MNFDSYVPILSITGLGRDAATEHWIAEDFRRAVESAGWRIDGPLTLRWLTPDEVPPGVDLEMAPGVTATAAVHVHADVEFPALKPCPEHDDHA